MKENSNRIIRKEIMERNSYVNFIPLTAAEEVAKKVNYRHEKQLEAKLRCIEQEEKYASSILNKKYSVMNKEVERLYLTRQSCLSYISIGDNGELCIQLNRKPAKTNRYTRPTMMSSSMTNRYFHKDRNSLFNIPTKTDKNRKKRLDTPIMPSINRSSNIISKDSLCSNMMDRRIGLCSNMEARPPTRSSIDSESSSCSSRSSRNSSPSSERHYLHQNVSRNYRPKYDDKRQIDKLSLKYLCLSDESSDEENMNKTRNDTDHNVKYPNINRPLLDEPSLLTDSDRPPHSELNRSRLPSPLSSSRPPSSKSVGRHSEYDELYVIEEVERENIVHEKNKKNKKRNPRVRSFSAVERSCEQKTCCKRSSNKEA